ncbi:MAG TPA: PQQ-dependent sugar dehydrogenase [Bryobacteraceae bacterium]|nr:PQQ-dependent sugar dehydrogenase [Bryobacteraceae bacterium]
MGSLRGVLLLTVCASAFGQVRAVKVAGGYAQPSAIAVDGNAASALYVVEQQGRIRTGQSVFLDISDRVGCCGERGLLNIAFPPGFGLDGGKRHFYLYYTDRAGDVTVSRFRLNEANAGDPGSETVLLKLPHREYANHNGGSLVFGPDGFLYIGTGDGGGGGDPLGNAQNRLSLLGKLLRIDVEGPDTPYGIPASNPFVARSDARPEVWAYGLRNPWRFSFDAETRDLYIADVGQSAYEEINFQGAGSPGGENYGWPHMEGMHCYQAGCSQTGVTLPVAEYGRGSGDCSVTGGYVYRGTRMPDLRGAYIYGDYCSGRIWALRRNGAAWQNALLLSSQANISTFGVDSAGELYFAHHNGGDIYTLMPAAPGVSAGGVVNAASFDAPISPGSLATFFGNGLSTALGIAGALRTPLPAALADAQVKVNGVTAPLIAVANVGGQEQINFQVPWDTAPGQAQLTVTAAGVESAPVQVEVVPAAPGLFEFDAAGGAKRAAALRSDYRVINTAVCETGVCDEVAHPGEVILLYATGLGEVENQPPDGNPAAASPVAKTRNDTTVTIGGMNATVLYAGLAPGFVGLYQINLEVPRGLPPGTHELKVTAGGRTGKPAILGVGGPAAP